jgi:hypothetical protein
MWSHPKTIVTHPSSATVTSPLAFSWNEAATNIVLTCVTLWHLLNFCLGILWITSKPRQQQQPLNFQTFVQSLDEAQFYFFASLYEY